MVCKFFDKESANTRANNSATLAYKCVTATHTGTGINCDHYNQQLAKGFHKPITRKFKKRKVYLKRNVAKVYLFYLKTESRMQI